MARARTIFICLALVLASGCDMPGWLSRISSAQIGADGIAVSFYPRPEGSSSSGDDHSLATVLDMGGGIASMISLMF